jgi:hypothetical protein
MVADQEPAQWILLAGAHVPEPATPWLFGLGLAGIGFMGRRCAARGATSS